MDLFNYSLLNIMSKIFLFYLLKIMVCDLFDLENKEFLIYFGFISYFVGVSLTLVQSKIVRFLSYGSISHFGLILGTFFMTPSSYYLSLLYLVLYFFAVYCFVYLLDNTQVNMKNLVYVADFGYLMKFSFLWFVAMNLLELGAFPSSSLFILKFLLLLFLFKGNFFSIVLGFVFLSIFSSYYYMSMLKNLMYDINLSGYFMSFTGTYYYLLCILDLIFGIFFVYFMNFM